MWSFLAICLVALAAVTQNAYAQYSSFNERRYPSYVRRRPYNLDTSASSTSAIGQPLEVVRNGEPVHLDIYYETNCPDSMHFITNQLFPLYQEMKDVLKIRLVPFGKATATYNENSKQYDFNCHHGPRECYGNTVQSCAISMYPNLEDHLSFVNCMESYPRPSSSGDKCARRLSLDWKKISKCAEGEEGNRLLYQNAKLTENLRPQLNFVPWIVANNVYTPEQQRMSLRNLKQVVCGHIKGQHSKCAGIS